MNKLINIHRNLFTVIKNTYKFNINHIKINKTDSEKDILNKIDKLSLVILNPQYYTILKNKNL